MSKSPARWLQDQGSYLIRVFAPADVSCACDMRLRELLQKLCCSISETGPQIGKGHLIVGGLCYSRQVLNLHGQTAFCGD